MKSVLVSLITLAAASPALAQINPATTDDNGDTIVVTASRSGNAVPINQLGASVTVLDAAALQQRQTRAVSDILRDVPGISVSRSGGVGGLTSIRIRGTEANHVLTLIDGIEVADPYNGSFDFGTMIADPAARIEVLRGQQSSLYGSDAIGGVIHYITLTGAEAPGYSAQAEGGSFETFNGSARAAGVAGNLDYAISAAYNHTGGTPTARNGKRDVGADGASLTSKLIWSPVDNFKLTGVVRYSYTDAQFDESESNPASPLFGFIVDSPDTYYKNNAFYGLVRAELTGLDGRWTNALSGQITDSDRKSYSAGALSFGNKGQRYKGSFESSLRFGTDSAVHRLTAAVDVEREQFQNTSPTSIFVFGGRRHTDNVGIVGQYEFLLDEALSLGGSVRHDENNRFADPTTWRAQGSYSFATGTRIRAAYGTGVKNPSYYELFGFSNGKYIGNPNLKPEKSEGWEAGIEQSFGDNVATLGATWFDSKLKNEIFTAFLPPSFAATPGNRGTDSRQHGVELFLNVRPSKQIRIAANYTYTRSRENGAKEVRRPNNIASVNATWSSADDAFSSTVTVRYNGRQSDVAFTNPSFIAVPVALKAFVLVNWNAEYKLRPNITVFGRVENLFDDRYEEVFSYATAGRAGYAGVRFGF